MEHTAFGKIIFLLSFQLHLEKLAADYMITCLLVLASVHCRCMPI